MFRSFFMNKKWLHWSLAGSIAILLVTWYKVQLDVKINEWFGEFYDLLQKALATPNSVTFEEWLAGCLTFMEIAALYIVIAVVAIIGACFFDASCASGTSARRRESRSAPMRSRD